MNFAIGLTIASTITLVGMSKVIWPGFLIDREADSGEPTPAELRQSRVHGLIMLGFGVVGLYALVTWDGTPAEFIGV